MSGVADVYETSGRGREQKNNNKKVGKLYTRKTTS